MGNEDCGVIWDDELCCGVTIVANGGHSSLSTISRCEQCIVSLSFVSLGGGDGISLASLNEDSFPMFAFS